MKATEKELLRFLEPTDKCFKVPIYQRNYDWRIKDCIKLIDDISSSSLSNRNNYFIGSIVVMDRGNNDEGIGEYLIIDGQQRLTTISLILIALRKIIDEEKIKDKIKNEYLINQYVQKDNEKIKLKSVEKDYYAFKKILDGKEEDFVIGSRITTNYNHIEKALVGIKKNGNILKFFDTLGKLMIVEIYFKEKDNDDPQLIFESINSTGLSLKQSDLVRNYVLMNEKKQEELYLKYWTKIEKNTNFEVSSFLRDYLTFKNSIIPKKEEVYEHFKQYYKENSNILELLEELKIFSEYYKIIISAEHKNEEIKQKLMNFNELKVAVVNPFLLEIFDYLAKEIIAEDSVFKILNYLETFIVRRMVCGVPTNSMNKIFMILGKEIKKNENNFKDNYYEILKYLLNNKKYSQRLPNNEEFKEFLERENIYNWGSKNKNFLLKKFETNQKRNIINFDKTSIEHIMPKKLTEDWKKDLGEDYERIHEKYLDTIGNLTLINNGDNSENSNKSFREKIEFIKNQSNYTLNNYFRENNNIQKWGEEEIKERAKYLINSALKIWGYEKSNIIKEEKIESFFTLDDDDEDFSKRKFKSYSFLEDEKKIRTWKEFYGNICKELYNFDKNIFETIVFTQNIRGRSNKYFSNKKNDLRGPVEISKNIFVECSFSSGKFIDILRKLLEEFEKEYNQVKFYLEEE